MSASIPLTVLLPLIMIAVVSYGGGGAGVVEGVQLSIRNRCNYTVWPGIETSGNSAAAVSASATGFTLAPGKGIALTVGMGWTGRIWGRTLCNFSGTAVSADASACATGDCGGAVLCGGSRGATAPATLAEFALQDHNIALDYYDVSLVDGFNLPMSVAPGNATCKTASCAAAYLNSECPTELRVPADAATAAAVVACKSACLAFGTAPYCCTGAYDSPATCTNTSYSRFFKAACPNAYTYAYDDPSSLFSCVATSYAITFCPAGSSSTGTTLNDRGISLHNGSSSSPSSSATSSTSRNLPCVCSSSTTTTLLVFSCFLMIYRNLLLVSYTR